MSLKKGKLTEEEQKALDWLLDKVNDEEELIPGSLYSEVVTPTSISISINLPEGMKFDEWVVSREDKVISGYVKRAIRVMLIQSGYTELPCPLSLIPEHPSDEEAMRIIRDAAQHLRTRDRKEVE